MLLTWIEEFRVKVFRFLIWTEESLLDFTEIVGFFMIFFKIT